MAHHLRRRLLAGLAATSVLTGVLPPAASALSTTATPSPPPTASASPSTSAPASTAPSPDPTSLTFDLGTEPNVRITSVGEPLLKSGADLKVQAVISNPTKKPLPISSASLLGQDWVPDTRNGVLQFLDGGSTALSQLSVRDSVGSVPAEQSITVDFTIPRDELNWQDSFGEWGPRGVEIEVILEDGTDLTDRSFVVVAPGVDLTPMPTGVVIPITNIPPCRRFSRACSQAPRTRQMRPRQLPVTLLPTKRFPQKRPRLQRHRKPLRTLRHSY